jgi:hypothetical protein
MARLGFVVSEIREIEEARQKRLEQQHETGPRAMVRLLARIVGVGVETADLLVHEVLSRPMRDRRAVAASSITSSSDSPLEEDGFELPVPVAGATSRPVGRRVIGSDAPWAANRVPLSYSCPVKFRYRSDDSGIARTHRLPQRQA